MRNYLFAGIGLGAGIAIGIAGMNWLGGVASQAVGTAAVAIEQANKTPDQQNNEEFWKTLNRINAYRHDDMQHCMDMFESEAGGVFATYQRDVSACGVKAGWDDTSAPDVTQQYSRIMKVKIRAEWGRDPVWLEKKMNEYFK